MIDYFNDEDLKRNHLKKVQNKNHPTIWYIYEKDQTQSMPIKVIKEIPFEHVQMYRELQYEDNPNIVKILDVARLQDKFILEMEYVKGILIGEYIEDVWNMSRQSSFKESLEIVLQVCSALKTCHKLGIVHRDISEKNIILMEPSMKIEDNKYSVVLIDFGNVHRINPKAVKDTTTVGTIGYAAPEQLGYSASDYSTDIYAVGILMCRMFTGKGREGVGEIENHAVRNIIKRCIRLEKNERYRNIDVLMSDLQNAIRSLHKWEKKSNNRIADSFLQYMDEEFNIDYSNTFLEAPDPIPMPIYVVLMTSMLIAFILTFIIPFYILLLCYIPYRYIVGGYFKKRLERIRFYYPFSKSMSEISENINVILTVNGIKFEVLDDVKMRITIEGRRYILEIDEKMQCLHIVTERNFQLTDIKLVFCMMDDYGKIVYLFQHLYIW